MRSISVVDCDRCPRRDAAAGCGVPHGVRARMSSIALTTMYPSGAVLFSEETPCRSAFILCSGRVKQTANSESGRSIIVRITEPGEILGLGSVLSGARYPYTAETLEPSHVTSFRREDFLRLLHEFPGLGEVALAQLGREIDDSVDKIRSIGLAESAAERLAKFLLSLAERHGTPTPDGIRIVLAATHGTIAQMIGVSRETVTREMARLRDAGVIELRKAAIIIRDTGGLPGSRAHRAETKPRYRPAASEVRHEEARPS